MTTTPDLLAIAPDLYRLRIPGGPAHLLNTYVHVGPDSVTLFDTGWEHSLAVIESALRVLGRSPSDVEHVVLSHFHEDHAGSAAQIAQWPHAVIVASGVEAGVVRGERSGTVPVLTPAEAQIHAQPTEPPAAPPCRVDLEVEDGDVLPIAGEAYVVLTPGHTEGSLGLHLPRLDVVLTGDTVAELNGQVIVGVFDVDRDLTRVSVQRLAGTGAAIAGFGHGDPVLEGASSRMRTATDPFAP